MFPKYPNWVAKANTYWKELLADQYGIALNNNNLKKNSRVGLVDNIPSPDKINNFVKKKKISGQPILCLH